jgi:hypothetical protein
MFLLKVAMTINILVTILGLFFLMAFESLFVTLFSFSILVLILFILIDKLNWKEWLLFAVLSTVLTDILLHRSVGVTLLAISISLALLYTLFLMVPKKQIVLSYIPYFFSIFSFYLLISLISPFVQDGIWGTLTLQSILISIVKSIVATILLFVINKVIDNFRSDEQLIL